MAIPSAGSDRRSGTAARSISATEILVNAMAARAHDPPGLIRDDGDEPAADQVRVLDVADAAPGGRPRSLCRILRKGRVAADDVGDPQ
jgi:hypothetical protein